MKNTFLLSLVIAFLAACGTEEPAQPVVEEQPAVEDAVTDETVVVDEVVTEESDDEALEVVEESAAEPEADEQAILLAQAEVPVAPTEWKFSEGRHYTRLVPTQPTVGSADKIEVAEIFYYLCPHCDTMEPIINGWAENKPANVRFVQIPAMWNELLVLHARMYYTHQILARNGVIEDGAAFHAAVFREIHDRRNRMTSENTIRAFFERFGVSAEEFGRTWNSFEVSQKLRVAQDLARRYAVKNTPTFVVNGKYRTGAAEAGGYPELLELLDELVVRESLR